MNRTHTELSSRPAVWRTRILLAGVLLLVSFPAWCEDPILWLSPSAALPGNEGVVELGMSDLTRFAGGDFAVTFDPAILSVVDINRTGITGDFLLVHGEPEPGLATVSMAGVEELPGGEGAIAEIVFACASDAPQGTRVPVFIHSARWYDINSVRHAVQARNALFAVGETVPDPILPVFDLGSGDGKPGDIVSVSVQLSVPHQVAELGWETLFDPEVLIFRGVERAGPLLSWKESLEGAPASGKIQISLVGGYPLEGLPPLTVASLLFEINGTVSEEQNALVGVSDGILRNAEGIPYESVFEPGELHITVQATPDPNTDFNRDGKVNQADLFLFLQTWHLESRVKP